MPRANVVRGMRKRPHFSKVSSPDVPVAAVEPRGLQNLKQTSTENQIEEQESEKRCQIPAGNITSWYQGETEQEPREIFSYLYSFEPDQNLL